MDTIEENLKAIEKKKSAENDSEWIWATNKQDKT